MNYISLKQKKILFNLLIITSFLLLSFISISILLKNHNLYYADDIIFHLRRIMDLYDSFTHGNILPDFSLNRFHGSGIMSLYPYLNLFPILIISFFIKSKISVIYYFFILNIFISFIISYYSSKNYIHSKATAYLFSIIYNLSNIFLAYNFTSMNYGLVSTYIFLPIVIFGFLKFINNKGFIELTLGISLIAFSHVLSFIIIILFLFLWSIINIRNFNKDKILILFKSLILFILITSIIWIPFLYLYLNNFNNISSPTYVQLTNINFKTFFSGLYGAKKIGTMGFFSLVTIFIGIFFQKKFDNITKQMYYLSLLMVFLVLFFPWQITSFKILSFLNQFQYTYRLTIIPQFLLSFIFALIITKYINKKIILSFTTIFIALTLQLIGQYSYIYRNKNILSVNQIHMNNKTFNLSNNQKYKYRITNLNEFYKVVNGNNEWINDYIPKKSLSIYHYINNNIGFYNRYYKIKVKNNKYNTFNFYNKKNMKEISLPLYLYNKEKLHVYLNGQSVKYYTNKHNLLTINNIQHNIKPSNSVYVKTTYNLPRIIGVILTLFGIFITLILSVKRKFTN